MRFARALLTPYRSSQNQVGVIPSNNTHQCQCLQSITNAYSVINPCKARTVQLVGNKFIVPQRFSWKLMIFLKFDAGRFYIKVCFYFRRCFLLCLRLHNKSKPHNRSRLPSTAQNLIDRSEPQRVVNHDRSWAEANGSCPKSYTIGNKSVRKPDPRTQMLGDLLLSKVTDCLCWFVFTASPVKTDYNNPPHWSSTENH